MVEVSEVETPRPAASNRPHLDPAVEEAARSLAGRTVWHVNSTAVGGGVAELLRLAMPWHARTGIESRWLVMRAGTDFFTVTKQLHHLFHGSSGDGRPLGEKEFAVYKRTTAEAAEQALERMTPGDVVLLHDPQTLGMAPLLREAGMRVAWRSHIGTSAPGPGTAAAWEFVAPLLQVPLRCVFHLPDFVPPGLPRERTVVIEPSIDETSEKCRSMTGPEVRGALAAVGLLDGAEPAPVESPGVSAPAFRAYAHGRVRVWQDEPLPQGAPVVLQVSRWDPLKDMAGVLTAFKRHIAPVTGAHLVLAGPDPADVADDPENLAVFEDLLRRRQALPADVRNRVHFLGLGLADDDAEMAANALVVNALQRHATVIAQKSLQEGFGLAVAEAKWKSVPVVASSVGGIRSQITHGVDGLLVDDPRDLPAFGREVVRLLDDEVLRGALGRAGYESCVEFSLIARELTDHARLYKELCETPAAGRP